MLFTPALPSGMSGENQISSQFVKNIEQNKRKCPEEGERKRTGRTKVAAVESHKPDDCFCC